MTTLSIRPADTPDFPAVAGLRWRWTAEWHDLPDADRAEFVRGFAGWARDHAATHRCLVAVRDGEVVGMAFLAVVERVPRPPVISRASGDVQCVYVVPEERDRGVGGQLIDAVLGLAAELGLERVVVHSSTRAVTAYHRHGFAVVPRLMQADLR